MLACMDARMGEVYWAMFHAVAGELVPGDVVEQVTAPESLLACGTSGCVAAAGKGLAAWPQIAVSLQVAPTLVFVEAEPHARDIAILATGDLARGASWLDAAFAQPVICGIRWQKAVFSRRCKMPVTELS